ncbi:hypothetical protein FSP39_018933 [Pinctada imbricata]|uniref:Uncharacterized protein n=1 Tax=Pinctada imbricata TaxID=66713 RepID=A0AA88XVD1_PINIB|nr:hypothetical protein FSP39_018933 [Pinctada imbricata]
MLIGTLSKIETGNGQNRIVRTIDRDSVVKNAPKAPVGMESQKEGADVKVDDVVSSDTYIVYRCKKMGCGGMADRLRGMINVYLLSLLTGRKFGIIHSTPCKLTEYLQPNTLDWTIDEKSLEGKSSENHNFLEKKKLPSNDMATYFKKEVVYIVSNADMTNYIRRDKGVPKILPWLNQLTTADIYKFVLDRLFKPSDMMKQEIDKFQAEVGNRKLICAHYRMGKNPSMPYDLVEIQVAKKIY